VLGFWRRGRSRSGSTMIVVEIPEAEWIALEEFIAVHRHLPYDVGAAIRAADTSGDQRSVAFASPEAVRTLIEAIVGYTQTWEVQWAVPLNRILPRLYQALDGL
jgi:hypothetical protein